ncbi:MAG: MazG nucleotide pyrophosphohydrolase domain-containing protein [Prevotella sp.]|nr:MazG nucleotide pyrophosphohydrolase domain-containing protein [Prevotella sp.]MDY5289135.1 MazG nucleotide pyrophosphohydrolase domain-containing protein [Prevotella sp.]
MANLTLNEYQDKAMSTCMPESDNLFYMLANLVGEVGEFASKAGTHLRKGNLHITTTQRDEEGKILHTQVWNVSDEERHLMLSEIGDILWQTAGLAKVMGVSLEEVAEENLAKLASRKQRNVIAGDGDER